MARNTRATCRAIMIDLQGRGFEETATRRDVTNAIVAIAGETRATRDRYINALKRHGFIKQGQAGLYVLDWSKVDDDSDMDMIGELTRRVSRLETIVMGIKKVLEEEVNARKRA